MFQNKFIWAQQNLGATNKIGGNCPRMPHVTMDLIGKQRISILRPTHHSCLSNTCLKETCLSKKSRQYVAVYFYIHKKLLKYVTTVRKFNFFPNSWLRSCFVFHAPCWSTLHSWFHQSMRMLASLTNGRCFKEFACENHLPYVVAFVMPVERIALSPPEAIASLRVNQDKRVLSCPHFKY